MVNSYPSQTIEEIWKSGDSLCSAWFAYAPARMRNQFSNASGEGSSIALRMLMEADVRTQLACGILSAFGFRTMPGISDGPEPIPAITFEPDAVSIDWNKSELIGLGRRFESIRVTRLIAPANENSSAKSVRPQQKKRGAKGYADILSEAIASLKLDEEHFADWTLEKQVMAIQDKAAALHPGRFKGGKPGRSTVYRHLGKHPA